MALRFRRSIKLAPGIRVNLGLRGVSVSIGPRGSTVTFSPSGTYANVGIPGTGVSYRKKISSSQRDLAQSTIPVIARLDDNEQLRFLAEDESPLDPDIAASFRRQHRDALTAMLQERADEINAAVERLERTHLDTPDPTTHVPLQPSEFEEPPPEPIDPLVIGLANRLIPGRAGALRAEHSQAQEHYQSELVTWRKRKAAHEAEEAKWVQYFEGRRKTNIDVMATILEHQLQRISWPHETTVSFNIADQGRHILIDADLPEVEDMPNKTATTSPSRWCVNVKTMSKARVRMLYATHVHAIGFRLVGEVFVHLPSSNRVTISGYSQRTESATGYEVNHYLFSARVERLLWNRLNFSRLDKIDPVKTFEAFELRRNMTKTGIFRPITPLAMGE